jgi:hypothetical protein
MKGFRNSWEAHQASLTTNLRRGTLTVISFSYVNVSRSSSLSVLLSAVYIDYRAEKVEVGRLSAQPGQVYGYVNFTIMLKLGIRTRQTRGGRAVSIHKADSLDRRPEMLRLLTVHLRVNYFVFMYIFPPQFLTNFFVFWRWKIIHKTEFQNVPFFLNWAWWRTRGVRR